MRQGIGAFLALTSFFLGREYSLVIFLLEMPYCGIRWNREPGTTELQTVPQNVINLNSLGWFLNDRSEAGVEQT